MSACNISLVANIRLKAKCRYPGTNILFTLHKHYLN